MSSKDYLALYTALGRLLQTAPHSTNHQEFKTPEGRQWLGRGHAIVTEVGVANGMDSTAYILAMNRIGTISNVNGLEEVFSILYRALAHCERHVPSSMTGSFIPVGNSFDAFSALSKILQSANNDVMIVDPYMDATALTEFGLAVPEGITLRLLTDEYSYKENLVPSANKWINQYGAARPLVVKLSATKTLHDRAIFIDGTNAWTLTQSLKDFAKRSPAEIVKADDTAKLKIDAYNQLWMNAKALA